MTVSTVDLYGAPSYGPIGRPPAGVVFHTPENADQSLQQALNTAQWQAGPGNTSGGSYHGILGWDQARGTMDNPDAWVMVRSVPWDQAAGGISNAKETWAPHRHPWIADLLAHNPDAYRDPNRWMHQISLGGKASWYATNGYPSGLVTRIAEWVKILEDAYQYDAVLTLHRHWQTNRTDPGPFNLVDLVLDEYERLYSGGSTPAPATRFSDVPVGHWAYDAIEWAAQKGITTGYPDGTFGPDRPLTRAESMVILKRALDA